MFLSPRDISSGEWVGLSFRGHEFSCECSCSSVTRALPHSLEGTKGPEAITREQEGVDQEGEMTGISGCETIFLYALQLEANGCLVFSFDCQNFKRRFCLLSSGQMLCPLSHCKCCSELLVALVRCDRISAAVSA